tara:strand:+ start:11082 stop:12044 length:963 start_codon:yes stop_codon:yes gene_type:complete
MKEKEILLFGASGQIGRNLIRKLAKRNYKVTAVTRNYHQKAYILKTQANPGYLEIKEANIFKKEVLEDLIRNSEICINLIGILYENKKNTFNSIHCTLPSFISELCSKHKVKQFIHLSALGIDEAHDSEYAKSKLEGEKLIKKNFENSLILRPSLVYSVDDNFTTRFMSILSLLPIFPIYYSGKTKFAPIHVSDLVDIIVGCLENEINSTVIDCVGPDIITFKDIIKKLLKAIEKKRLIIPMPLSLGKITASIFETFMSKPLLTLDQLKLLKYDNINKGNNKTNFDFNLESKLKFDTEIEKYAYMWKESGQFSQNLNKIK